MAKLPEMTTDFARWYSEAFMDNGTTRDLRWKGVVDVTTKRQPTPEVIEVLARLAFPTSVPASGRKNENIKETYNNLVSTISGKDPSFDPSQSKRELQVLAAAALARLVETCPDAALVVTTASCNGTREPEFPFDLVGLAEKALVDLSGRKHARTDIDKLKLNAPKMNFNVASEESEDLTESEQRAAQIGALHEATTKAIEHMVEEQNRVVEELHRQMQLDEEELQMLWWLIGSYSRSLDTPFSEIQSVIKPLALADELGNMTEVSPGPSSVRAMLSKAGVDTEKVKLEDAINAADLDWAKMVSESRLVSPVTTPIHFALEQRAEL
jgi:hypothetical protein